MLILELLRLEPIKWTSIKLRNVILTDVVRQPIKRHDKLSLLIVVRNIHVYCTTVTCTLKVIFRKFILK